jgi:hypothetical protein
VASPQDINDYDDGPGGLLWGYNWHAHLVTDAAALLLTLGSVAVLGLVTLVGGSRPF